MNIVIEKKETAIDPTIKPFVDEMFKAGVHIGHSKSKRHPKMARYIFATRHNISLIDLSKTVEQLNKVAQQLKELISKGNIVLFVGTHPEVRDLVINAAKELNQPFVGERWLGGTLTNFKTITKRLEHFHDLVDKKKTGQLVKYTKKEQLSFERKVKELERKFDGLHALKRIPDMLFVVDVKRHKDAIAEARHMGVKVVGIVDTDANPEVVDYAIPANDGTRSSISCLLSWLVSQIKV